MPSRSSEGDPRDYVCETSRAAFHEFFEITQGSALACVVRSYEANYVVGSSEMVVPSENVISEKWMPGSGPDSLAALIDSEDRPPIPRARFMKSEIAILHCTAYLSRLQRFRSKL